MRKSLYELAFMLQVMSTMDSTMKDKVEIVGGEQKEPVRPKGVRQFIIDGVEVWTINEKMLKGNFIN